MSIDCAKFYILFLSIKPAIKVKEKDSEWIEEPLLFSNIFYRSCRDEFSGVARCFLLVVCKTSFIMIYSYKWVRPALLFRNRYLT